MKHTFALGVAATAAIASSLTVAPAHAGGQSQPTAEVISVGKVQLIDGKPFVAATYRCTGALSHLWVSAKQGGKNLDDEGSGAKARAWWQRTMDNKVVCDDNARTILVRLRPTGDTGMLRPDGRRAWVQFCLLTANTPEEFEEGGSSFASNMRFRDVIERR